MKLYGVTVRVILNKDGKDFALGARSDDFRDHAQFLRAVDSLGFSLLMSTEKLINEGSIKDISIPWQI